MVCWLGITQTEKHEIMDSLYYDDMIHTSIENKGKYLAKTANIMLLQ